MNNINFENGIHLSLELMQFLQNASKKPLSWLGASIDKNCIVYGCGLSSNTYAEGAMCINGELLPFVGGAKKTYGVIKETADSVNKKSGVPVANALVSRYVQLADSIGADETGFEMSSLIRLRNCYLRESALNWYSVSTISGASSAVTDSTYITKLGFKYDETTGNNLSYTINGGRLCLSGLIKITSTGLVNIGTFDAIMLNLSHDIVFMAHTYRKNNLGADVYSDEFFTITTDGKLKHTMRPDSTLESDYILYTQATVIDLD